VHMEIASLCSLWIMAYWHPDAAAAQHKDSLSVEDALSVHQFGQLMPIALSPDGELIAYTVQDHRKVRTTGSEIYACTGVPPWAAGTDILVLNTHTGEERNLTGGKDDNWLPVWSLDGQYLAFLSDRGVAAKRGFGFGTRPRMN